MNTAKGFKILLVLFCVSLQSSEAQIREYLFGEDGDHLTIPAVIQWDNIEGKGKLSGTFFFSNPLTFKGNNPSPDYIWIRDEEGKFYEFNRVERSGKIIWHSEDSGYFLSPKEAGPANMDQSNNHQADQFNEETNQNKVTGTPLEIGESVSESINAFIGAHFRTIRENSAKLWSGMFISSPYYCYAKGNSNRSRLMEDRQKLIEKYPDRSYQFNEPQISILEEGSKAEISFSYDYSYSGQKNASGTCVETINVIWVGKKWLISKYEESVDKNN